MQIISDNSGKKKSPQGKAGDKEDKLSNEDLHGALHKWDLSEDISDEKKYKKNLNKEKLGIKDAFDAFPVIFGFFIVLGQVLMFIPLMILDAFEGNPKIGKKYFWLFAIVMIVIIVIVLEQADR